MGAPPTVAGVPTAPDGVAASAGCTDDVAAPVTELPSPEALEDALPAVPKPKRLGALPSAETPGPDDELPAAAPGAGAASPGAATGVGLNASVVPKAKVATGAAVDDEGLEEKARPLDVAVEATEAAASLGACDPNEKRPPAAEVGGAATPAKA
eukprot:scaffold77428_cov21-Tisochrysis_lutea.AAC.2